MDKLPLPPKIKRAVQLEMDMEEWEKDGETGREGEMDREHARE